MSQSKLPLDFSIELLHESSLGYELDGTSPSSNMSKLEFTMMDASSGPSHLKRPRSPPASSRPESPATASRAAIGAQPIHEAMDQGLQARPTTIGASEDLPHRDTCDHSESVGGLGGGSQGLSGSDEAPSVVVSLTPAKCLKHRLLLGLVTQRCSQ